MTTNELNIEMNGREMGFGVLGLMSAYLVHTQYEISRDQQVCVHGVGSDSEVHNLHVINRIEIEFYIS